MRTAWTKPDPTAVRHKHRYRFRCECGAVFDVLRTVPGAKRDCQSATPPRTSSCFFTVKAAGCFVCATEEIGWDEYRRLPEVTA